MMIEQNTNYAYKMKYMANPTFDKVRELSTKFYLELPQELKDELYEALHRGIDILDSEPQMTAYIFAYGKMHQAKLNYAFEKLSDNFFGQEEINIIDYGCGQAIGTMCYADYLRKNGYSQKAKTITLIEPSEICLKRAALHVSAFFPDAEIKTVNKGFNDLDEKDIICDKETPTLHILSNVLDIFSFDICNFAELIKKNLKGKNQFVCVAPYYNGNEKDNRMDLFASKINGSNIITRKYKANEFIPEKEWTCKMICFQKNMDSFEMIEDSGLDSPISVAPQMTDEPHSIDYAITSIKELREEGFNVIHITSQKDNKNYLKIIKGSRFILLEDKISKTISDDAPLKVSIWHYNDNGKIRTVSLGKIENLDIENPNSEDLEQHTIYYEATEKLNREWITNNSISNEFQNGKGKIRLKDDVTEIGVAAFEYCYNLTYIKIPNSITKIKWGAFKDCKDLTEINIPNSVTSIEECAFYSSGLTSITIPNSVTKIERKTFKWCDKLSLLTIPNSVTSIGYEAFLGCGLTSVTIPYSVTSIDDEAFCGCSQLESISVDNRNTAYDSRNNCNAIIAISTKTLIAGCKNTIIPNFVTRIGSYAFYDCSGLTSVIIPNSIMSIGNYAFQNCCGLTSINIPNSVTNIGSWAFLGCSGLTSVNIPESVTYIDYGAFSGCCGLKSVTIPNTVSIIKASAFEGCSGLTSIIIPNSVTEIGDNAFDRCKSLESITIPDSVTKIGSQAFRDCENLTSIFIPNSVNEIGKYAFSHNMLNTIIVDRNNPVFDSRYNCNAIIETKTNVLHTGCKNTKIPNSVTKIGSHAFSECKELRYIHIPNSVAEIGDSAFGGCIGLFTVVIPNSVTSIGNYAFSGVKNIVYNKYDEKSPWGALALNGYINKNLLYNNTNKKILLGCNVFSTNATIPHTVKEIDGNAFYGNRLTTILVDKRNKKYDSRDNCNAIIETETNTLIAGCKNTTIPMSVTCIGHDAFRGCSELKSIIIPDSVTKIESYAFSECNELTYIHISNSVTSIGDYAFYGCNNLPKEIKEKIEEINSGAFVVYDPGDWDDWDY